MEYDPNAPAFGADAQKPEDLTQPAEAPKVEATEETPVVVEETEPDGSPVPYKRFKKFHDLAREAEAEADRLRAELAEAKASRTNVEEVTHNDNAPFTLNEWVELYGDSDIAKKAYEKQVKMFDGFLSQAEVKALEAIDNRSKAEAERTKANLKAIDENLESLADYAGHELSEAEQSAVLDIVDGFSAKDKNGNYINAIPFEKAYDIYELQQQAGKAPKVESRNKIASLSNSKSQGAHFNEDVEREKNFQPGNWDAGRRRAEELTN